MSITWWQHDRLQKNPDSLCGKFRGANNQKLWGSLLTLALSCVAVFDPVTRKGVLTLSIIRAKPNLYMHCTHMWNQYLNQKVTMQLLDREAGISWFYNCSVCKRIKITTRLDFNRSSPYLFKKKSLQASYLKQVWYKKFEMTTFNVASYYSLTCVLYSLLTQVRAGSRALYRPLSAAVVSDARKAEVSYQFIIITH